MVDKQNKPCKGKQKYAKHITNHTETPIELLLLPFAFD